MHGDSARAYLPILDRNMVDHQIEFQPLGRRGSCPDRETLLVCAYRLGVELSVSAESSENVKAAR